MLDATHFIPHHPFHLEESGADVVACSAYKFFGPHIGIMGVSSRKHPFFEKIGVHKIGLRELPPQKSWEPSQKSESDPPGGRVSPPRDDLLFAALPSDDNCQISRWEMGTLNYEALAGFDVCVNEYLKALVPRELGGTSSPSPTTRGLGGTSTNTVGEDASTGQAGGLDVAYRLIQQQETKIAHTFLDGIRPYLEEGVLRLHGSRSVVDRTTTFAVSLGPCGGKKLVESEEDPARALEPTVSGFRSEFKKILDGFF